MVKFPKQKNSKFMGELDLNHEIIEAAEIKVFWKSFLTIKRSKGQFKMTVFDVINKLKNHKFPLGELYKNFVRKRTIVIVYQSQNAVIKVELTTGISRYSRHFWIPDTVPGNEFVFPGKFSTN